MPAQWPQLHRGAAGGLVVPGAVCELRLGAGGSRLEESGGLPHAPLQRLAGGFGRPFVLPAPSPTHSLQWTWAQLTAGGLVLRTHP